MKKNSNIRPQMKGEVFFNWEDRIYLGFRASNFEFAINAKTSKLVIPSGTLLKI
jgi:hypothetical protein